MTIRNLLLAGVAVAGLAAPALAANDIEVGSVWDREYHDAQGIRVNGDIAPLHYRDTVYSQEKVSTGPAGRTALEFLDLTRIQVGANSTVVLDKYVFDPGRQVGLERPQALVEPGGHESASDAGTPVGCRKSHLDTRVIISEAHGRTSLPCAGRSDKPTLVDQTWR